MSEFTAAMGRLFHNENPNIYKAFEERAMVLIARGVKHFGASTIVEVLRYEAAVNSKGMIIRGEEFKIPNDMKTYYSRLFKYRHPHHADLFKTKRSSMDDHVFVGRWDYFSEENKPPKPGDQLRLL